MHVALLKRRDDLSDRKAIGCIVKHRLAAGTNDSLLKRYKEAKKLFAPMLKILDNLEATTGKAAVVETLQSSLFGDEKETILSPDEASD